ncbi:hypothetical protein S420910_089 [Synechococcus phage S-CAM7]|uniref:Uncharacterized protein n=2 Tax=Synechococcus phage S-CAM7 TaxID=1883368 RepID=A0A1D8KUC8_9CAUD|nr:hypothetical protein S420910_089 [Synechococcus phage S-CAM7]
MHITCVPAYTAQHITCITQHISQHICTHYAVYLVHVHAVYNNIVHCGSCHSRSIFVCLAAPPLIKAQRTAESLKDPGDIITYAYHAAQVGLIVLSYILF